MKCIYEQILVGFFDMYLLVQKLINFIMKSVEESRKHEHPRLFI